MGAVPTCRGIREPLPRHLLYISRRDSAFTLQWRHNVGDGVSNHQHRHCLLNRLFRRRSKKTSKLCVTGLCEGISPVTGEFPARTASNAKNVSIWWRHYDLSDHTQWRHGGIGEYSSEAGNILGYQTKTWYDYTTTEMLNICIKQIFAHLPSLIWMVIMINAKAHTRHTVVCFGIFEQKLNAGEHMLHHKLYS